MNKKIELAKERAIKFLGLAQEKDGSFMCLVSRRLDDYSESETVPAIVPTNIVLSSLVRIPKTVDLASRIKKKAADFLLRERGPFWSFNYWFRSSDWYKKEPYPDDLDDTFCALAALYEYDSTIFDGEVMAKIITMLTSAEKAEGGPYDMWLVPSDGRKTWNDTDLVVNSNIAYFLHLQNISLPKLDAFIENSIEEDDYEFPYNRIYPGLYFISRFYKGKLKTRMIKLILSRQEPDGKWENPLRTALAVSTLMNLADQPMDYKDAIERALGYLLKTQGKDGSWAPYSFYYQMKTSARTLYAGSASITTALAVEAMYKWILANSPETEVKATSKNELDRIEKKVLQLVSRKLLTSNIDLNNETRGIIRAILRADKDRQIALLPYFFALSLGKMSKTIPEEMIVTLGAANTLGWIAYTIYDDLIDGEGKVDLLPIANIALRGSSELFGGILPKKSGFSDLAASVFNRIDSAMYWEIKNCRGKNRPDYGDFSELSNRSFGHALGPAAIMFYLGYVRNSHDFKSLMLFFKNYIIARQLNDDAHDWEADLRLGQTNAVAARIFETASADSSIDRLREEFWNNSILKVARDIKRSAKIARTNLSRIKIIEDKSFFKKLLADIEAAISKALKERRATIEFIRTYSRG